MGGVTVTLKAQREARGLAGVPCSDLVTTLGHGRGRGRQGLDAGGRAGQTGLPLDTSTCIPRELPGNDRGPLSSSCSQRLTVARPRETKRP